MRLHAEGEEAVPDQACEVDDQDLEVRGHHREERHAHLQKSTLDLVTSQLLESNLD